MWSIVGPSPDDSLADRDFGRNCTVAHSMSILDRIEWRNSSDFIERINAVESVGGRIVLSHITIRHLNEISAPIGSAIIHQTRKLSAAETAFKTASDDRILASQGWSRWGFVRGKNVVSTKLGCDLAASSIERHT